MTDIKPEASMNDVQHCLFWLPYTLQKQSGDNQHSGLLSSTLRGRAREVLEYLESFNDDNSRLMANQIRRIAFKRFYNFGFISGMSQFGLYGWLAKELGSRQWMHIRQWLVYHKDTFTAILREANAGGAYCVNQWLAYTSTGVPTVAGWHAYLQSNKHPSSYESGALHADRFNGLLLTLSLPMYITALELKQQPRPFVRSYLASQCTDAELLESTETLLDIIEMKVDDWLANWRPVTTMDLNCLLRRYPDNRHSGSLLGQAVWCAANGRTAAEVLGNAASCGDDSGAVATLGLLIRSLMSRNVPEEMYGGLMLELAAFELPADSR